MKLKNILTTPGWHRSLFIRRTLAGFFLLLAAVLFIHSLFSTDPRVAVFVTDIQAGSVIHSTDMELRAIPPELVPEGALTDTADAEGRISASTITSGEIVTAPRFVGNELIASFVINDIDNPLSEELNMVPLKLADPSILPLLHHGDTISVVSQDPETGLAQTIASGGRVILVGEANTSDPSTLLIALPETTARTVAAASLHSPLAVVLTGERAQ
ncbi:MAG: hypothetical protein GX898_10970 [Corynebacterium sp.]|uniref:SAF domain-containing protein n=1 Tax=uncultured Corynebacterium sp. TaxID=159447 RepID=UPI0017F89A03|nr:SAF domain-containing protein [uncultured Corynebacterium sp.]NLZ58795.1 hypothetical protein [Corynebacterium sp.]